MATISGFIAYCTDPSRAALSDAQVATAYNAEVVAASSSAIDLGDLRYWAATSGARKAIEDNLNNADQVVAATCLVLRDILQMVDAPQDLGSANGIKALFAKIVQANVLNAAQKASLQALQATSLKLYTQPTQFGQPATPNDVHAARS